jgi:uncharacterized protein (UPF0264 family)
MSDINTLFPIEEATFNGETIKVEPFKFGQFPKAIKLLRPITDAVKDAGIAGMSAAGFSLAPDWPMRLPQVMDEAGEALIEFVAFATNKQRSWFDDLDADEGIALTKLVFEVNGDFFVQRIAPKLGLAVQSQASPETGEQSSPV